MSRGRSASGFGVSAKMGSSRHSESNSKTYFSNIFQLRKTIKSFTFRRHFSKFCLREHVKTHFKIPHFTKASFSMMFFKTIHSRPPSLRTHISNHIFQKCHTLSTKYSSTLFFMKIRHAIPLPLIRALVCEFALL